jgi:hypothetical protein
VKMIHLSFALSVSAGYKALLYPCSEKPSADYMAPGFPEMVEVVLIMMTVAAATQRCVL